jgi:hypothetical protein
MPNRQVLSSEGPIFCGDVVLYPLNGKKYINRFVAIDHADLPLVAQYSWHINQKPTNTYAERSVGESTQTLHAFLTGNPETDHINRNGLDNRRINLRTATRGQNMHNRRIPKNNTSGYTGVSWHPYSQKWAAGLQYDGKRVHCGYFTSKVDAARAYDQAAIKYFGEFAHLNFPMGGE